MAIRKTIIEEDTPVDDPRIVKTTHTVVNPDIHTEVIEDRSVVDSNSPTIKQSRVIHEPLVKTEHPQSIYETKKTILRFHQIIWYILGVIEILLGFRIALKAIGADPFSGFVSLIYALSGPLAFPFAGIVRPSINQETGAAIEWSTFIAMAVYFLVALGIVNLIHMAKPVTPEEVDRAV